MKTVKLLKITSVLQLIFCIFCISSTLCFAISRYYHSVLFFSIGIILTHIWIINPVAIISFLVCLVLSKDINNKARCNPRQFFLLILFSSAPVVSVNIFAPVWLKRCVCPYIANRLCNRLI